MGHWFAAEIIAQVMRSSIDPVTIGTVSNCTCIFQKCGATIWDGKPVKYLVGMMTVYNWHLKWLYTFRTFWVFCSDFFQHNRHILFSLVSLTILVPSLLGMPLDKFNRNPISGMVKMCIYRTMKQKIYRVMDRLIGRVCLCNGIQ